MAWAESTSADRQSLWTRRSVRNMLHGLMALGFVIAYGTAGFVALGWSLFDAFYMVAISVSTVGYGEVRPLDTPLVRAHAIATIALGTVVVAYTLGSLVAFMTEGEIHHLFGSQRMRRQIQELKGQIVVAGFGRMGTLLCSELAAAGESFVVIERDPERLEDLRGRGCLFVQGDASEERVLEEAGLQHARALVIAIPSDADSVFITLTARQLVPSIQIVARAEQPSTQKKLRQAGADHVVLPAAIGAHRIASLLTSPSALEFAELVTQRSSLAIQLEEILVHSPGPIVGLTLRDADIGRRTGVIVVAIKRADGTLEFPPAGDVPFQDGDTIVLLGRSANLAQFREAFQA